jgi:hypothetical protein
MSATRSNNQTVWLFIATILVFSLGVSRLWLIPAHFSTDTNEGWNAFQAANALGAGPLYPSPQALTSNNYPPLSFYLVGWAGRFFGDTIVAGRIVSLISVLVVAAEVFVLVRRFTGPGTLAPSIGTLLFLGFNVTLFRSYYAMNDPEWLAHALMMMGVAALIPRRPDAPPSETHVVAAGLLVFMGGMVKHNLIAFPVAITVWLALYHRRSLLIWILTAFVALLIGAMLCYQVYGVNFFIDLFFVDRYYSWVRMIVKSTPVIAAMAPMLAVSLLLIRGRKADRRVDLLLSVVIISVVLGVIQRSGQGVDYNAHFEMLISLCIACPVALNCYNFASDKPVRRSLWLILPFIVLAPLAFHAEVKEIFSRKQTQASWNNMENRLSAIPGNVTCETSALCYWAGKNFEIDFFLYGQRVAIRHDAMALQRALDEHRFSAIELDSSVISHHRRGEVENPILPIIESRYRIVFTNNEGLSIME